MRFSHVKHPSSKLDDSYIKNQIKHERKRHYMKVLHDIVREEIKNNNVTSGENVQQYFKTIIQKYNQNVKEDDNSFRMRKTKDKARIHGVFRRQMEFKNKSSGIETVQKHQRQKNGRRQQSQPNKIKRSNNIDKQTPSKLPTKKRERLSKQKTLESSKVTTPPTVSNKYGIMEQVIEFALDNQLIEEASLCSVSNNLDYEILIKLLNGKFKQELYENYFNTLKTRKSLQNAFITIQKYRKEELERQKSMNIFNETFEYDDSSVDNEYEHGMDDETILPCQETLLNVAQILDEPHVMETYMPVPKIEALFDNENYISKSLKN